MNDVALRRHECGAALKLPPGTRLARTETCPKCEADLHCRRNRRFRGYFEPRSGIDLARKAGAPAEEAGKKFDSLFN